MSEKTEKFPGLYAHGVFAGSGDMLFKYPNHYYYYDTPGDKDLAKKIAMTSAYAAGFSGVVGVHETLMLHKPKNVAAFVSRMSFWTGPPIGVATAFCTGTYFAAKIRGKDDCLSHCIGGVAAGAAVGAWRSSIFSGFVSGMFLGLAAALMKMSVDYNCKLFPETYRLTGGATTSRSDFTIWKDNHPRGWTTNPDEA